MGADKGDMTLAQAVTLGEDVRDRLGAQRREAAQREYEAALAWRDDPDLERLWRELDHAAEHDPNFFSSPDLAYVKQEVAAYRHRKTAAADVVAAWEAAAGRDQQFGERS